MKVDTNVSARTLRVAVRDLELEVGCWSPAGAPAGADLVLLHEGLGSLSLWRDFPEQLAAATGRQVWAWSRQGYGASGHDPVPRTPDYLEIEARDWLPATLAALGIERPVLVGHSDGGSIALLHGLLFPGAQAGLVAIAPHSWVEEESLAGIRIAGQSWRDSLGKAGGLPGTLGAPPRRRRPSLCRLARYLAVAPVPSLGHPLAVACDCLPDPGGAGAPGRVRHPGPDRGGARFGAGRRDGGDRGLRPLAPPGAAGGVDRHPAHVPGWKTLISG